MIVDKPFYIGVAFLELSNRQMYESFCDVLQPHYGEDNNKSHYMDADSCIYRYIPETVSLTGDMKDMQGKILLTIFQISELSWIIFWNQRKCGAKAPKP